MMSDKHDNDISDFQQIMQFVETNDWILIMDSNGAIKCTMNYDGNSEDMPENLIKFIIESNNSPITAEMLLQLSMPQSNMVH